MAAFQRFGFDAAGRASSSSGVLIPACQIATAGQSWVGINIGGTFVGTLQFQSTYDGINWGAQNAMVYPSGTAVSSATATGTWYIPIINMLGVRVYMSAYTSGNALVTLTASQDASFADAFSTLATQKFVNSVATGATNTLTVAANANHGWLLEALTVSVQATATWAANPVVTVKDGSTLLWAWDVPVTAQINNLTPFLPTEQLGQGRYQTGLYNTVGNSLVIAVASGGGTVQTNINACVSAF
jgi:hypothetical protein